MNVDRSLSEIVETECNNLVLAEKVLKIIDECCEAFINIGYAKKTVKKIVLDFEKRRIEIHYDKNKELHIDYSTGKRTIYML